MRLLETTYFLLIYSQYGERNFSHAALKRFLLHKVQLTITTCYRSDWYVPHLQKTFQLIHCFFENTKTLTKFVPSENEISIALLSCGYLDIQVCGFSATTLF